MRRLGNVVNTAQGMVIARSDTESFPAIGVEVIDERLTPVGRVVDIIGPVQRPYIVIDPTNDQSAAMLLNQRLYYR